MYNVCTEFMSFKKFTFQWTPTRGGISRVFQHKVINPWDREPSSRWNHRMLHAVLFWRLVLQIIGRIKHDKRLQLWSWRPVTGSLNNKAHQKMRKYMMVHHRVTNEIFHSVFTAMAALLVVAFVFSILLAADVSSQVQEDYPYLHFPPNYHRKYKILK